jgi:hypothetical protein
LQAQQKKLLEQRAKRKAQQEARAKERKFNIMTLDLSNNFICQSTDKENGLKALAASLKHSAVQRLDLSRNKIKSRGASFIGELLENNEVLTNVSRYCRYASSCRLPPYSLLQSRANQHQYSRQYVTPLCTTPASFDPILALCSTPPPS